MKKTFKAVLCVVLVVAFVLALAGCGKINYITNGTITAIKEVQDGTWNQKDETEGDAGASAIEPFVSGTYGGIEFADEAAVINYYVQCYNNTKAQTANYIDGEGNTVEYYALVGEEKLNIDSVLIEGSENAVINNLVPTIVDGLFKPSVYGLPPCNNRDPLLDNSNGDAANPGQFDFRTSYFTPEDSQACNVVDNGDGTITITIQPKASSMSMRGEDSQGRFFEVLGDIGATVDSISQLSWASGSTEENCLVDYEGGTGVIKINTSTNTVVEADYHMKVNVAVNHANVLVIKDKSAAVAISYDMHYPASDEYLLDARELTRA